MSKGVIIEGSSRVNGNTNQFVSILSQQTGFDVIHLSEYNILAFDYEFKNATDDFLPLFKRIVDNYELLIFASPVYWYSMNGIMKNFFDRISDCLTEHKQEGRKLKGKSMGMLSCSNDNDRPEEYTMPFKRSAEYLHMSYLGDQHCWMNDDDQASKEAIDHLNNFGKKLIQQA